MFKNAGKHHIERQNREKYDSHGGRFDGDRPDLQPDMVSRPLTRDETQMFLQEGDEELPEVKPRSKEKPSWMNRRGEEAKHNHLIKSKDRLKQLKKSRGKRKSWDRIGIGMVVGHLRRGRGRNLAMTSINGMVGRIGVVTIRADPVALDVLQ